jgi:hypothetical protein
MDLLRLEEYGLGRDLDCWSLSVEDVSLGASP